MSLQQQFTAALDELVGEIRGDRSVLAAILCGSLSHDAVWSRSDIDLVLVTIDDKKVEQGSKSLNANGINVHTLLMPRALFRRGVEGALRHSFWHSLLAKGKLLYSHDESLPPLFDELQQLGARDTVVQRFHSACSVLPALYKAHKFLETRKDLHYVSLWVLYAATSIAQLEVLAAGRLLDREVIPQAQQLNPKLFKAIYTGLLDEPRTYEAVAGAVETIDRYMEEHARTVFAPLIDYLIEIGEARSSTELASHFSRTMNIEGVDTACEYLADVGIIAKVAITTQLTPRSNVRVQEVAFVHLS